MAKLKAVFDRFDTSESGQLSGAQVEQALVYMGRPVDSADVFPVFITALAICNNIV